MGGWCAAARRCTALSLIARCSTCWSSAGTVTAACRGGGCPRVCTCGGSARGVGSSQPAQRPCCACGPRPTAPLPCQPGPPPGWGNTDQWSPHARRSHPAGRQRAAGASWAAARRRTRSIARRRPEPNPRAALQHRRSQHALRHRRPSWASTAHCTLRLDQHCDDTTLHIQHRSTKLNPMQPIGRQHSTDSGRRRPGSHSARHGPHAARSTRQQRRAAAAPAQRACVAAAAAAAAASWRRARPADDAVFGAGRRRARHAHRRVGVGIC